MKNKLIIFLILFVSIKNISLANQFQLDIKNLEVQDNGDLIIGNNGTAFSKEKNIKIEGTKFEYFKNPKLLRSYNSKIYIYPKNLEITSDRIDFLETESIFKLQGNVEIFDNSRKTKISSTNITYDLNKSIISSDTTTTIKDKLGNIFTSEKFENNLNNEILKLENVNFTDIKNNNFKIELAFINLNQNKLIGKDINIDLNNTSFNSENEPRLKGKSTSLNENKTELTKGAFTLCKRRDGCPPWQLKADKITHDKIKKTISYSNAWLEIYDIPVVYLPKFFHPDPTVKRQSGFLMPTLKNSPNRNSFLSVPYFHAVKENMDLTYTPRFYNNNKFLLQTEFRQKNKDSTHNSDVSIMSEKNKNHIFYEYYKKINGKKFSENIFNFKVQQTNDDTYLKSNGIKSFLIDEDDILETSINLQNYSEDTSINSNLTVYEDLSKSDNDRYEYIFPQIELSKYFNTNFNGSWKLDSSNYIRQYNTNILEKININDLLFTSKPKITKLGFYNNYELLIKNSNSNAKNSTNYKNDNNFYLSSLFQFNSSLPLIKKNQNYQKILKPNFAIKISPENDKNISGEEIRIDVDNIYSLDRLSSPETVEGGVSLAYGSEYSILDENTSKEILALKIANNLRFSENENLPKNNQLGSKTSNFFGEVIYSPNELLTTKYNFSTKNNFQKINYENIIGQIKYKNFTTSFDYINERDIVEKNSYLLSSVKYNFNDTNNLSFSTRENKTKNLTEYYNLIYQYKNDCLSASIEYNKAYYDDRDIKPEETIFFKVTIIPFGETSSPNLIQ